MFMVYGTTFWPQQTSRRTVGNIVFRGDPATYEAGPGSQRQRGNRAADLSQGRGRRSPPSDSKTQGHVVDEKQYATTKAASVANSVFISDPQCTTLRSSYELRKLKFRRVTHRPKIWDQKRFGDLTEKSHIIQKVGIDVDQLSSMQRGNIFTETQGRRIQS